MLTPQELAREAAATGFPSESLEKVLRLLDLLGMLRSHPYLKERIALKGGTALNLFVFDVPRLSVDVDLNYIGAVDRETMLAERPKVDEAVQAVCERAGLRVRRIPDDHAGGKWRLSFTGAEGRDVTLELDLNYLLRTPLWRPVIADSRPVGRFGAKAVPVLDVHELAAGKLAALFARSASRDLFDVRHLLRDVALDRARLRLAFVVYGGANRRDWRTISVEDVRADAADVERQLVPVLRGDVAPEPGATAEWTERLVGDCRKLVATLLPLESVEMEFLTRLNDRGDIVPRLLTPDSAMQAIIASHPALLWKALNVRGRG